MSAPVRIAAFALALVVSLGAGYGIGTAASPAEVDSRHSVAESDLQATTTDSETETSR